MDIKTLITSQRLSSKRVSAILTMRHLKFFRIEALLWKRIKMIMITIISSRHLISLKLTSLKSQSYTRVSKDKVNHARAIVQQRPRLIARILILMRVFQ